MHFSPDGSRLCGECIDFEAALLRGCPQLRRDDMVIPVRQYDPNLSDGHSWSGTQVVERDMSPLALMQQIVKTFTKGTVKVTRPALQHFYNISVLTTMKAIIKRTFGPGTLFITSDYAATSECKAQNMGTCGTSAHIHDDVFIASHSPQMVTAMNPRTGVSYQKRVTAQDVWRFLMPAGGKNKHNDVIGLCWPPCLCVSPLLPL